MENETSIEDIHAEFRRIGVDPTDIGGIALGPSASMRLFRDWLREIPDGAGHEGYLHRVRGGRELTDEELHSRARADTVDDIRRMLEWRMREVTWAERGRYLALVAADISATDISPTVMRSVCHFCGGRPEGYALGEGRGGATICVDCAENYAYTLRHSGPGKRSSSPNV